MKTKAIIFDKDGTLLDFDGFWVTVSENAIGEIYLFYYRAIDRLGASKAMALNITYTAWAIVFTAVLCRDFSVLNPVTVGCAAIVVVCGIFAATDFKKLFTKKTD